MHDYMKSGTNFYLTAYGFWLHRNKVFEAFYCFYVCRPCQGTQTSPFHKSFYVEHEKEFEGEREKKIQRAIALYEKAKVKLIRHVEL